MLLYFRKATFAVVVVVVAAAAAVAAVVVLSIIDYQLMEAISSSSSPFHCSGSSRAIGRPCTNAIDYSKVQKMPKPLI